MAESLSRWLALRQEADFAARSPRLTRLVVDRLMKFDALRLLDLGTGTGSNIRYLAPRIAVAQDWCAVDKDERLLAEFAASSAALPAGVHVETRTLDLGALTDQSLFEGRHLVTASALLDLVSEPWIGTVAGQCRRVGACALFTITYNGRNRCDPADADDDRVFELFNQHQLTDKGLGGPAVGPAATDVARRSFADAGFDVQVDHSDWEIEPEHRELQRILIEGWALAAAEMAPSERHAVERWRQRRLQHVANGQSRIVVGHGDLAALTDLNQVRAIR